MDTEGSKYPKGIAGGYLRTHNYKAALNSDAAHKQSPLLLPLPFFLFSFLSFQITFKASLASLLL